MAEFFAIDHGDHNTFVNQLENLTADGQWSVISSNAYFKEGETRFYALLEKLDHSDHKMKILDSIQAIQRDVSDIETNTGN